MNIQPKMFLMSGLPGSGKSTLADQIAELYLAIVCSADDYFMEGDVYNFDRDKLGHAHAKCRKDAQWAVDERLDVVVDNTNVSAKELKPYVDMALAANYRVYVFRPNTPWAEDVNGCQAHGTHGVPMDVLVRMRDSIIKLKELEATTKQDYTVINSVEEVEGI